MPGRVEPTRSKLDTPQTLDAQCPVTLWRGCSQQPREAQGRTIHLVHGGEVAHVCQ